MDALPSELWLSIINYLHVSEIITLSLSNKGWHKMIFGNTHVWSMILFRDYQMTDNILSYLTYSNSYLDEKDRRYCQSTKLLNPSCTEEWPSFFNVNIKNRHGNNLLAYITTLEKAKIMFEKDFDFTRTGMILGITWRKTDLMKYMQSKGLKLRQKDMPDDIKERCYQLRSNLDKSNKELKTLQGSSIFHNSLLDITTKLNIAVMKPDNNRTKELIQKIENLKVTEGSMVNIRTEMKEKLEYYSNVERWNI